MAASVTKPKLRTAYALRVRQNDAADWSEPDYYLSRKHRDQNAAMARIWGGLRTHSYETRKAIEDIEFMDG